MEPLRITLGKWVPHKAPSVEFEGGRVKFIPGEGARDEFQTVAADFPLGSRIEYRVQRGDIYFQGDHAQSLGRTLSVVEPNGRRELLAGGFILYMEVGFAAKNLLKHGIPFRAVSFYKGEGGQEVEQEIPTSSARIRLTAGLVLGLGNLFLGLVAGLFVQKTVALIAVGAISAGGLSIVAVWSATAKKTAVVNMLANLPIYVVGYAVMVVLTRAVFRRELAVCGNLCRC